MEHRLGKRLSVTLPVELRFQDRPRESGVVLNIGRGGMFVEVPQRAIEPQRVIDQDCLEVCLLLDPPYAARGLLFSTMIVHRFGTGLGLMFCDLDDLELQNWQALDTLLESASTESA